VTTPAPTRTMSAVDAAFLYIERKEIPLHIASICVFDGPISFPKFVACVNSKLHLVPRYRQIPHFSSWGLDFPTWQDDPHFDIHRHIIHKTLPAPGGETELQALASGILSQLLDRNKPLWDVHVVDGLNKGRGAIIFRVHHALADGIAGLDLMKLLLEPTPNVPRSYPKPRYRRARSRRAEQTIGDSISSAINSTLGSLLELEGGMLRFAQSLFAQNKEIPLKELLGLLPEFTASIERLPFNKPCTGARQFCWAEFDLADVQTIRDSAGGTVNDVILAVLTRALARYVKRHGQSAAGRFVRIICPVNLRSTDQTNGLGNQISFLPVALPMDAGGGPVRMLKAVTARTATLKRCGALGFVGVAAKWLAAAPPPVQALFWRSIPEIIFPVPVLNMICTNVVGSPTPLYAVGRKMLAAYPQVPTGYDLGVGCAVHSYNGKLFFGLIADTDAAPDVEHFRDFLALSFEELRQSVTHKKTRKKKSHRVRKESEQLPLEPVPVAAAVSTSAAPVPKSPPAPEVTRTEAA
jgi:diacylglycerol O-acyltransferase / wax synthase